MSALSLVAGVLGSAGCVHHHYYNEIPPGCGDGAVIQYGAPGVPVQTGGGVSTSSAGRSIPSRVVANPLQAQADGGPLPWRRSDPRTATSIAGGVADDDPTVDR
jgi:hypothetical protein